MGSTRLPGKPLLKIHDIPLIERVWRIAKKSCADRIIVATDDIKIHQQVQDFGGECLMTPTSCKTGTDRVAQVAKELNLSNAFYINLQGDALLTPPWVIDAMISAAKHSCADIITPARKLTDRALQAFLQHKKNSPSSGTCVVFDQNNKAMYFSKTIIPYHRDKQAPCLFKHIGLYGYGEAVLLRLHELPQTPLEQIENLEQLRALENGMRIEVVEVDYQGRTEASIDTAEDIIFAEQIIQQEGELID